MRPDPSSGRVDASETYRFTGTLLDRLEMAACGDHGAATGITFIEGTDTETFLSYRDLRDQAELRCGQLRAMGILGDGVNGPCELLLPIEDNRDFAILFWASMMAGAIPVPIAAPAHAELNLKLLRIWRLLRQPRIITTEFRARKLFEFLKSEASEIEPGWVALEKLCAAKPESRPVAAPLPGDLAFLQFSSGSTGDPKGVRLTHTNLLANIGSTLRGSGASTGNSMLSWMPLSHDMGLIGVHLRCVCAVFNQFLMPTSLFIRRPRLWLDSVHRHRATDLMCPNFGYEYLLSTLDDEANARWDLSCVRVIFNGAEPISETVARRFCAAMAAYGMFPHAILACYGLAENTLAVSLSLAREPLRTWWVSRDSIAVGQPVRLAAPGEDSLSLVDCGVVVDTVRVRITGDEGEELPDLHVGRILIAGESTTDGYYNNPEATGQTIRDGWLDTGDLGFLSGDRLVFTGRAKELINLNGANFYLYDIERVVEEALGVESGSVAACGCRAADSLSEQLVLFIRHKGSAEGFATLADVARREVAGRMGVMVADVVQVRRIPKTTSGKVQRYRLAETWRSQAGSQGAEHQKGETLRAIIREVKGLTSALEIDPDRALADQGIDSLAAVELSRRLGALFGLTLPVSLAFDYPNPTAIASYLDARKAGQRTQSQQGIATAPGTRQPIAIIGAGVRLPGGIRDLDSYWRFLADGRDAISEVPPERWSIDAVYHADPDRAGKMTTRFGAFLEGVDQFDAPFFEISGAEARDLDPQQRMLLETSWEALENAGQNVAELRGTRAGVFVGISSHDYARRHVNSGDLRRIGPYSLTGATPSAAAGRIAYCFGFEGPAMSVDTACSSSLAAVHLAARSLADGESSVALAAGVNLILGPEVHVGFSKLQAMAKDGRSKVFDAAADGYVRGEGCVVVVMKRLAEAVAAGDPILAVLRGTAVNQDGASNGFTAPNGLAQRAVIRRALEVAGVEAATVGYVEAHGTGTPLGDPQEMAALAEVYGKDRARSNVLRVGSVKTNIGHTEAAAGLAGLLKAVLCVREGAIPPSLHFRNPSPHIAWADIPIRVPVSLEAWPENGLPRRAGVSSFGFTGTNAHAVVEAAPARAATPAAECPTLLLAISAKSAEALAALRASWIELLSRDGCDMAAICQTAALRRAVHRWRLAVVGSDRARLMESLRNAQLPIASCAHGIPRIAFVFPGQGSQWLGMGREMMAQSKVFRATVQEWSEACRDYLDIDIARALAAGDNTWLSRLDYLQPALVAFEVAMARVWQSFGIEPAAVIGHSMGEVAAAYIAGALSPGDAARVICKRSALLGRIAGKGAMCSADLTVEEAEREISEIQDRVSIAASNARESTVLAGDPDAIDTLAARLEARGVYAKRVKVDVASHSPQVDALIADMNTELAGIRPDEERVPFCSTVTGTWCLGTAMGTQYWIDNLRQPVMFSRGVEALAARGINVFIEMSPHPVLVPFIEDREGRFVTTGSMRRDEPEIAELYSALGRVWEAGANIDWKGVFPGPGMAVPLPAYPWQRQRYWLDEAQHSGLAAVYPDLGPVIEVAGEETILRECEIRLEECPWLEDHKVDGTVVFPAAAFIELAARVANRLPVRLDSVRLTAALSLRREAPVRVQVRLSGDAIEIRSREQNEDSDWTLHCAGSIREASLEAVTGTELADVTAESSDSLYARLKDSGLQYGPAFRLVESVRVGNGAAEAIVAAGPSTGLLFSPAFLDACFQTLGISMNGRQELWIPWSVDFVSISRSPGEKCIVRSGFHEGSGGMTVTDQKTGAQVLSIEGLQFKKIDKATETRQAIYSIAWHPLSIPAAGGERRVALAGPGKWFRGDALSIESVPMEEGVTDVVYVAPIGNCAAAEDLDVAETIREVARLMELVQALAARDGNPPRLRLVTRDGDPTQSALRGFFRSVAREFPEFRPVAIDLRDAASGDADLVLADWPDTEPEIVIRGEKAFVPRIAAAGGRIDHQSPVLPGEAIRAEIERSGDLEQIAFTPMVRRAPGPGEVEVEVAASGLNFLNVLSAMGLYPGCPGGFRSLGIECAGRVVRCGAGVSEFSPGEAVFGIAEHTLASHVLARAVLLARNPGLDAAEAAALPVAYLTAAWSLRRLARLEPGETVLIHSATGGVGRAAIEIARHAGASVIGTAGSGTRRGALRGLGIEHVFDSRTLEFEREVRQATSGRGVDVILNSLSGDAIDAGLRSLAPFGRFVDISKRDFYGKRRVALETFRSGVSYFAVDLDWLAKERETQLAGMWRELVEEIRRGELKTLPVEEYGFSEVAEAFGNMARASHREKIVLVRRPSEPVPVQRAPDAPKIDAGATYMVTGGTGAVGVLAAGWILEHGGRNVVLAARRDASAEVREAIRKWNGEGANVRIMQADVADAGSVNRLLSAIERSMPPLSGIVHAAGVLADSTIGNMDADAIAETFAAKVGGALNLHSLTLDMPLDFFIMVSSAAGILGAPGQANYAAANACLGGIAELRRRQHLPAVAVALGPVAGMGLAANASWLGGLPLLEPEAVGSLLFESAGSGVTHPLAIDLSGYRTSEGYFAEVTAPAAEEFKAGCQGSRIAAIRSRIERLRALEDLLAMLAARLLRCDPAIIDADIPFKSLGLDSLMAMQLRNRLNDELCVRLSVTTFWKHPSPRQYAEFLDGLLQPRAETPVNARAAVEDLSEAEAERLLAEKAG